MDKFNFPCVFCENVDSVDLIEGQNVEHYETLAYVDGIEQLIKMRKLRNECSKCGQIYETNLPVL